MLPNLIFFFADLQSFPKCIKLYEGLNISRIKFLLVTPKTITNFVCRRRDITLWFFGK